jgi:hypothetical protein
MTKKYFIRQPYGEAQEVTHDEYFDMAYYQFMGTDIQRILETATQKSLVCGTTHMFWTETTE